ncbi:hypothetical protein ACH5RR_001086 [Cinchona calisaya]|uniref:Aminotransferase-like plant mobile domain-containing protein n=1 Tax=Cinchona calisaya TaxID=153742 RepID=A0ABD3B2F3_9GENT
MAFTSGAIPNPSNWSEEKHGAFIKLGVDDVYRDETYLATLISCWICIFALSICEVGLIRPGTFVIVSLIAEGIRVCLAMPVLASIYRSLNGIANSSQPGKSFHAFPAHYVHVWLAQYFNTHQLNPPRQPNSTMAKFFGSSSVISFDEIEIYTPHRFARQFGFCQDLLGEHKQELPASVLERLYQLYRSCTHTGEKSKLGNIHFIVEGATLDGPKSSDNTILGPNQFELVARNLGKPSDLTPFSIVEKRLHVMPTMLVLVEPILCSPIAPSIFSVTAIAFEQHHIAVLEYRIVELVKELEQLEVKMQGTDTEIRKVSDEMSRDQHLKAHLATDQANLKNTLIASSKDSEDLEALRIFLKEE